MERLDDKNFEKFQGNWNLFEEVLNNKNILFLYDLDGILVYSTEIVLRNFRGRTGIDVKPHKVDQWEYLKKVAIDNNLTKDIIDTAENDWFRPDVLGLSQRYLYAKPITRLTVNKFGVDRNLILTARDHSFKSSTEEWMEYNILIPSTNLLIRDEDSPLTGLEFKVDEVKKKSKLVDWIVFIDDSVEFIKGVLESDVKNCLAINVPQGVIKPNFDHEHLIVIGRNPEEKQAMHPLYKYLKMAIKD